MSISTNKIQIDLKDYLYGEARDYRVVDTLKWDQLGRGVIIYFPRLCPYN